MVRMHLILAIVAVQLFTACVPLTELDGQESTMLSCTDSLELQLSECRAQNGLFLDRMGAIERENLQLDDMNRKLSARLSEMQFGDSLTSDVNADPVADPDSLTPAPMTEPQRATYPTAQDAGTRLTEINESVVIPHAYASGIAPDIEYLRAYQSALQAHNTGDYERAFGLFETLLRKSSPNDMADNCWFWMAEARRKSRRAEEAIELYSAVLACVPSDKTASALFARAQTFLELDQSIEAQRDLERLRTEFPSSREAQDAARLLRNSR